MTAAASAGAASARASAQHRASTSTDPHCLPAQVERHLSWLDGARLRRLGSRPAAARPGPLLRLVRGARHHPAAGPQPPGHRPLPEAASPRYRKKDGTPLCLHTPEPQALRAVAGFCKWLARERLILYNPAAELELPKTQRRLPRAVPDRRGGGAGPRRARPRTTRSACATAPSSRPSTRPGSGAPSCASLRRVRPRRRARRRGRPARQGQEGPLRADRRAGPGLDRASTSTRSGRSLVARRRRRHALPRHRRRAARRATTSARCVTPRRSSRPTSASAAPATSSGTPWRP